MFLIFDAGSTKTDVRLVSDDGTESSMVLQGINPFFMEEDTIQAELARVVEMADPMSVGQVFYYGAGCVAAYEPLFERILGSIFPLAKVEAHSDLYAACRATLGDSEGIACILGTGSNSCHYRDGEILKNVSPLGFILGDEGSGAVLGKLLVGDVLKGCAPADITEKFWQWTEMDQKGFIEAVYRKPFPNRFLATFTRFLGENIMHPYCQELVEHAFVSFFERNILQYDSSVKKIGFVGSVAFHFSEILQMVAQKYGYQVSVITQRPMDELVRYHALRSGR